MRVSSTAIFKYLKISHTGGSGLILLTRARVKVARKATLQEKPLDYEPDVGSLSSLLLEALKRDEWSSA